MFQLFSVKLSIWRKKIKTLSWCVWIMNCLWFKHNLEKQENKALNCMRRCFHSNLKYLRETELWPITIALTYVIYNLNIVEDTNDTFYPRKYWNITIILFSFFIQISVFTDPEAEEMLLHLLINTFWIVEFHYNFYQLLHVSQRNIPYIST